MSEEELMQRQQEYADTKADFLIAYRDIPYFLLDEEVGETRRSEYLQEFAEIAYLYSRYKIGADFLTEGSNNDYVPSHLVYKKAAMIMNKEARFLFSNPPTFNINRDDVDSKYAEENAVVQKFLDKVLQKNNFNGNLMKAVKDCFIGKRIAIVLNVDEENGITTTFLNSLQFVYETTGGNNGELKKFVTFYEITGSASLFDQRWFKKVYVKEKDGVYLWEGIYTADGEVVEVLADGLKVKFPYIPVTVVLNDGLIGDKKGVSEFEQLLDSEGHYSKLANCDMDAMRRSMNPVRYTVDASQNSTKNLSISPGSYWDIQSDDEKAEEKVAKVGIIEPALNYSSALKTTLDRLENQMYSVVDVPNINRDQLAGVITSGKTIGALYWGLTVRCDEKMLAWQHSLSFIAEALIDAGKLYPQYVKRYLLDKEDPDTIPDIVADVTVENNYPIPDDIKEEKEIDLQEVLNKVRSKKSYIKKWQKMNDKDADLELEQIKAEQEMFENALAKSYNGSSEEGSQEDGGEGNTDSDGSGEERETSESNEEDVDNKQKT